jgi:Putative prokaryotic signal transducing protein
MPEEMVTIAKFFSLGEAKVAQGRLSSEGISVFVCDEHTHAINWHMGAAFGGIRLQVPERQVVRALEILDGFVPDATEEDAETEEVLCCPECESLEIREVSNPKPRQISLWSSVIPFPEPRTQATHCWRCLMCGYRWQEEEE